jgi:cyclomaltodextrin glucanotransferase
VKLFALLLLFQLPAAASDFRDETIYFVMTDRYVDGDPANNDLYGDEYKPGNLRYYQGGDFRGLIDNLGHIQGMGFTAVWITPPVMQPPGRYVSLGGGYDAAGYHGYWAWDFSKVDPHLESPGATYDDLVAALRARGLKLVQDVVANHGHGGYADPSVKWYADRGKVHGLGRTFDYHDDRENWFTRKGPVLADLLDFDDANPEVRRWLIDIYKGWQARGADAFRIDTVGWMSRDFWRQFTAELHANKKDFFMFGEAWTNDDIKWLSKFTRLGKGTPMDAGMSVLDMPGSAMGTWGRFEKVFKGGDYSAVDEVLKHDGKYADPTWLVTYLDNHDKPRFNGAEGQGTPATAEQYTDALNWYFTARGIPCVYYGTEIRLPGGEDPDNRRLLGPEGIAASRTDPVYLRLRLLNAVRKASPALRRGRQKKLYSSRDQYAFRRDYEGETVYVLLNKAEDPAAVPVKLPPGEYQDLFTNTIFKAGGAPLKVPAHGALALRRNLPAGRAAP